VDLVNIEAFAKRVISLAEYRKSLHQYLADKMQAVRNLFPNFIPILLCTTGFEGNFWLVKAKVVKTCTGASAMHKFVKNVFLKGDFLTIPVTGPVFWV